MFDLKDGDLKIAKVLWNIAIPLFLAAPVAFFAGIEFPFGFFNLFMSVATYYALKLCTDAEKSLMTPFYLFFLNTYIAHWNRLFRMSETSFRTSEQTAP